MCYAQPGPRCSNHLSTDIAKLEIEIKELEHDSTDAAKFKLVQKRSRLDTYRFAFDGTQKGQKQLQAALDSMDSNDPDYRDIKKYKDSARNAYDLKLRNFKEAERIREERDAQRSDLLARKAKLEAELASLDSTADAVNDINVDEPETIAKATPTSFSEGRAAAVAGARKAAKERREEAASRAANLTANRTPESADAAADAITDEAIRKQARGPRRSSTSSSAYTGKGGYGGKGGYVAPSTRSYAYSGKGYGGK